MCYMISWRWGLVCDEQQSTDLLEIFLKINSYSMAINVHLKNGSLLSPDVMEGSDSTNTTSSTPAPAQERSFISPEQGISQAPVFSNQNYHRLHTLNGFPQNPYQNASSLSATMSSANFSFHDFNVYSQFPQKMAFH
ncbi:unnamed protein product [Dracunculus medinensis]|uniref:Ovule protein n=1 Tax=Dracunculus medinensis TaxID=318479 RepID=A0A0N4UJZ4_DRAME|nr:unnamed protein product [Dracunculus medinensis]